MPMIGSCAGVKSVIEGAYLILNIRAEVILRGSGAGLGHGEERQKLH